MSARSLILCQFLHKYGVWCALLTGLLCAACCMQLHDEVRETEGILGILKPLPSLLRRQLCLPNSREDTFSWRIAPPTGVLMKLTGFGYPALSRPHVKKGRAESWTLKSVMSCLSTTRLSKLQSKVAWIRWQDEGARACSSASSAARSSFREASMASQKRRERRQQRGTFLKNLKRNQRAACSMQEKPPSQKNEEKPFVRCTCASLEAARASASNLGIGGSTLSTAWHCNAGNLLQVKLSMIWASLKLGLSSDSGCKSITDTPAT